MSDGLENDLALLTNRVHNHHLTVQFLDSLIMAVIIKYT
jgi:hypothetical protein